jgi:predicted helicase
LNCLPAGCQCLPLYRYTKEGGSIDNITDWALEQFKNHYQQNEHSSPVCYAGSSELREEYKLDIGNTANISKENIFHYVYAVLHHPAYRKKYELNLKREFPRIPFYDNFPQWRKWGKDLMELHIGYESVQPYDLKREDITYNIANLALIEKLSKAKLKADKATGTIELDGFTKLTGVPKIAWEYKLGNRSALEWVLDQYKEKKPSDPTIAEKFNTYRFANYKEQVIDLLKRVCTVSVETMNIIKEMPED